MSEAPRHHVTIYTDGGCAPVSRIAPQPPGPGSPEQAPSVQIETVAVI